jgi:hypothetical protein
VRERDLARLEAAVGRQQVDVGWTEGVVTGEQDTAVEEAACVRTIIGATNSEVPFEKIIFEWAGRE